VKDLTRALILIYALSSAALYSGLMPPWEGFDELYHYGVVQHVATTGHFPEIGKTTLSRELWNSLDYLPVSHYIQPYLERPSISFEDYFRLTPDQRSTLRQRAESMDRGWRQEPSLRLNYEAKQAPLTYYLLAPLDAALAAAPILTRVLALRIFVSFLTIVLLWIGTIRLAELLDLTGPLQLACLLVVFSSQMLYAETSRIGNDALAAPWLVWLLATAIESVNPSSARTIWKNTVQVAILMALGLLIKSYLLVFLPLVCAVPLVLHSRRAAGTTRDAIKYTALSAGIIAAVAGGWYWRNIQLYGHFMGSDEMDGMGVREFFHTAAVFPWVVSIPRMLRAFLWTGNNSFVTFSQSTLNAMIALLGLAMLLYAARARRNFAEIISLTAIGLYFALLILISFVFFRSTRGLIDAAMPWYAQVLLAPVLILGFLGLARGRKLGRWIALAIVLLWTYVAVVSWIAKLIPLYGGFEDPHARPLQLLNWYLHRAAERNSVLSNLCPAPLPVIYLLLAVVLLTLAVASVRVLSAIYRDQPKHDSPA
jgi:hypothetical protein